MSCEIEQITATVTIDKFHRDCLSYFGKEDFDNQIKEKLCSALADSCFKNIDSPLMKCRVETSANGREKYILQINLISHNEIKRLLNEGAIDFCRQSEPISLYKTDYKKRE
jgi:hypothetical protein